MQFTKLHSIQGHSGAIYSLQFDETYIYSASADKYVVRWNVNTGEQDKFAIKMPNTPYSIQLIDSNSKLAIGLSTGHLHFVDLIERKELKLYTLHNHGIFAMLEIPQHNLLFVGDGNGLISVWNTKTLELVIKLPFDCGKIRTIIFDETNNQVIFGSQDGKLRFVEINHYNLIHELEAHQDGVGSLLLIDNEVLISGGKDAHLKFWDLKSMTNFKSIPAHNFMIYDILRLNQHHFITASRDKTIKIWELNTIRVLQRLDLKAGGHRHSVNKLLKISDNTFASCSDDARILTWGV